MELTPALAMAAAKVSLQYALPMAAAVVYATAREIACQVATSDPHFASLPGVIFIA